MAEALGVSRGEIELADQQAGDIIQSNPEALGLPAPAPGGSVKSPLPAAEVNQPIST